MTDLLITTKTAETLINASDKIESLRRVVNEAYSKAPENLHAGFRVALDQLSDYQYKGAWAWKTATIDKNPSNAEVIAVGNIEEARRRLLFTYIGVIGGVIGLLIALIGRENVFAFFKWLWHLVF